MCVGAFPAVFRLYACLLGWMLMMLLHQYLTFHQAPPFPTQLPVQPTSHPNHNKVVQYTYSADLHNFPTFTTYPDLFSSKH
jgi:hypothetical protein